MEKKKDYSTQYSRVVPHPSTDCADTSLTSEIGRDPVLSGTYGRNRRYISHLQIYNPRHLGFIKYIITKMMHQNKSNWHVLQSWRATLASMDRSPKTTCPTVLESPLASTDQSLKMTCPTVLEAGWARITHPKQHVLQFQSSKVALGRRLYVWICTKNTCPTVLKYPPKKIFSSPLATRDR